jgi:hypothetical protein
MRVCVCLRVLRVGEGAGALPVTDTDTTLALDTRAHAWHDGEASRPLLPRSFSHMRGVGVAAFPQNKAYSRDFFMRGRFRIQLRRADGSLLNPSFPTRKSVLLFVAKTIAEMPSRPHVEKAAAAKAAAEAEAEAAKAAAAAAAAASAGGGRHKKNRKKK